MEGILFLLVVPTAALVPTTAGAPHRALAVRQRHGAPSLGFFDDLFKEDPETARRKE
jgi:hypothetical protein